MTPAARDGLRRLAKPPAGGESEAEAPDVPQAQVRVGPAARPVAAPAEAAAQIARARVAWSTVCLREEQPAPVRRRRPPEELKQ